MNVDSHFERRSPSEVPAKEKGEREEEEEEVQAHCGAER